MRLRALLLIAVGGILIAVNPAFAQLNAEDGIELTKTYIETDRKTIVMAAMELTEEQSKVFWPVYSDYRNAVDPVNDSFVDLLKKYADNYDTLTDEMASEMMMDYLDIEEDRLILKKIYIESMAEVLPMSKVARFFQIENKMDAIIKFDLAAEVPFAMIKEEAEVTQ